MIGEKVTLRVRMSVGEAHYAGELVNGSHIVDFWGDVGTELAIRLWGDESLFLGYEHICRRLHGVHWLDREGGQHLFDLQV